MDKMPAMIRMKLKKNPFGEPHIYINAASIHAIVPTRDGSTVFYTVGQAYVPHQSSDIVFAIDNGFVRVVDGKSLDGD